MRRRDALKILAGALVAAALPPAVKALPREAGVSQDMQLWLYAAADAATTRIALANTWTAHKAVTGRMSCSKPDHQRIPWPAPPGWFKPHTEE